MAPDRYDVLIGERTFNRNGVTYKASNGTFGILYSVGFSSFIDYIDKEYVIGKDVQVIQNNNELKIEGLENYLPNSKSLYPSINLYPRQGLYPQKSKYKYAIFKYKVWQENLEWTFTDTENGTNAESEIVNIDTGYYYHQAIELNKHGLTNLKIKYERN